MVEEGVVLWLLAGLTGMALASDAGDPSVASVPTPVESWVRRDVRADRQARVGAYIALASPALFLVGQTFGRSFNVTDDPLRFGASLSAQAFGIVGTVVGPILLLHGGWRSARALRSQGVVARGHLALVGTGLLVLSSVLLPTSRLEPAGVAAAATAYGAALGLGVVQLRANHLARQEVGWVGVVPLLREGTVGLTLAGQF